MIPILTPFIFRLLGERFKPLAIALSWLSIALLLIVAWNLWLHFHDKGVIAEHEAGVTAQVEIVADEASDEADAEEAARQAEFEADQAKAKKEIEDAKAENRSPFDAMFDDADSRIVPIPCPDSEATKGKAGVCLTTK